MTSLPEDEILRPLPASGRAMIPAAPAPRSDGEYCGVHLHCDLLRLIMHDRTLNSQHQFDQSLTVSCSESALP